MGILNVTPDSFSDGGRFHAFESALSHAEELIADGAAILDVGGESTRPYADPVSLEEELERVIPVIEAVRSKHAIPISIDTMKAEVARRALEAGADIINDISALRHDPAMIEVARKSEAPIIVMHMQGTPSTMQDAPHYENVVEDIHAFFAERLEWLTNNGVARERIILDPGIGFGKTLDHNLSLIKHMDRFRSFGLRVLLGHSRKGFIGKLTGRDAEARDLGTAVVAALAAHHHIDIIRVHNVSATKEALQIAEALLEAK